MDWPVFSLVSASSACTTLLGSSPVRCWEDAVPETQVPAVRPYAVWTTVGGAPENYLEGVPTMDAGRVQVSVYADSKTAARATAKAIRDAIEPSAHMVSTPLSTYESDTKLYVYLLQFQFWTARS
jgi:hypothetical protein